MSQAFELLEAAARGQTGVDRRFLRSLLSSPDASTEALRFARSPQDQYKIDIDPLLVDLFRHWQTPDALEFYVDAIRRSPDDVDESLIQALLPFGDKAAEPLLKLYGELEEDQSGDVAFLLAALRVRHPKVLELLLERLEYDAADGAFCLGLYGDVAARPALERMLAEIPAEDVTLHREVQFAIEQLNAPEPKYQPEPFDLLAEYPELSLPPYEVLEETERLHLLRESPEADIREGAAYSFFNQELSPAARKALLESAKIDADASVRGYAWSSLGDATEKPEIRDALIATLNNRDLAIEERTGAAVGLYAVADRDDVRKGLEELYEMGGFARAKALEAMWRSLHEPYAKFFPPNLDDSDPQILRHALRGSGYFRQKQVTDKIATFFDRPAPYDDLREDALFAYALAMPGNTSRGRVKGMLRKIDQLAGLDADETELVMFALDERLRLLGLAPVFEAERMAEMEEEHEHDGHDHHSHNHDHHEREHHAHASPAQAQPPAQAKPGRNDPCPCGSGKKYKKCHGGAN